MSKFIKGIYLIIVGWILITFPPLSNIDMQKIRLLTSVSVEEIDGNKFLPATQADFVQLYTYSVAFMIIGVLTILYGAYTLWEAYNEKSKSNNSK